MQLFLKDVLKHDYPLGYFIFFTYERRQLKYLESTGVKNILFIVTYIYFHTCLYIHAYCLVISYLAVYYIHSFVNWKTAHHFCLSQWFFIFINDNAIFCWFLQCLTLNNGGQNRLEIVIISWPFWPCKYLSWSYGKRFARIACISLCQA